MEKSISLPITANRGPTVGGWPLVPPIREGVEVVAVTNVDISLLGPGDSIDGITLGGGERVLLTQQTDATQNGIYVVQLTDTGYRSLDWSKFVPVAQGTLVAVTRGTVYAGTVWSVFCSSIGISPTIIPGLHSPTIKPVNPINYVMDRASLPATAIAQNMPRTGTPFAGQTIVTNGTAALYLIGFNAGQVVSSVTFCSGGTGLTAGSDPHLWAVLCDSSGVVKAVTADDTSPTWSANTPKTFTFGASYTIPVGGYFYAGLMFAYSSGGTVPTLTGVGYTVTGVAGIEPITSRASSTGQTTPPALAASLTLGAVKSAVAYVSAA